MRVSFDKLIKNLSDKDFKYLVEEFGFKNLRLLKQKGAYPYEYMNSFERFSEEKLSARKYFCSSTKDRKIGDDGKKSDGYISLKDHLTCEKIWDKLEMENMGDRHHHYLKKHVLLLADVLKILWAWSLSLFEFSWTELGCDIKNDWCRIKNNIRHWQVLLIEKGLTGGISYIVKDMLKQKTNTWKIMAQKNRQNL